MPDAFDFAGKVVLVTGSSRGIGASILAAFARCGARCVVNYLADSAGHNRSDADRTAADINAAATIECDVGDAAQVSSMIDRIGIDLGRLDVLVNNAGILMDRTIAKMPLQTWEAVLRVNLTGAFNCIQHAARILPTGGRIVNISSASAHEGYFGQANYAASKAGVIALTKVAARELAKRQITVNAVAPGVIDTEMSRSFPEEVKRRFLEQIPLERFGRAEDIAGAVLFLCSSYAQYITGQVIHVNGGLVMP